MDNEIDTMEKFIQLWEETPTVDPTKAVQSKIRDNITKQASKTTNHAKINPKDVVNKAVVDAAAQDPLNTQDVLNKNPSKMKKEHFMTFEEFMTKMKTKQEDQ